MKTFAVILLSGAAIFFIAFFAALSTQSDKPRIVNDFNPDSVYTKAINSMAANEFDEAKNLLFIIKGKAPQWRSKTVDSLYKSIDVLALRHREEKAAEFAALMKSISKKHDDFQKVTFYESKRNNWVNSRDARFQVEIYVGKYDEGRKYFRIRTEYKSESWMFYENVQLLNEFDRKVSLHCDYPEKKSEVFTGGVREWSDDSIDESEIINLTNGDKITARFDGKYRYDFNLSRNQVTSLKEMVKLYKSL